MESFGKTFRGVKIEFLRNYVDARYDAGRDALFERTRDDPKQAHREFIKVARRIDKLGLSKMLLNCSENDLNPGFEISNAAGFNKNGDIPPRFLKYLGFDRVVIGTVTGDYWEGNDGQTIWRYPQTLSMVNYEGLPGLGAEGVAKNLSRHGNHDVSMTMNVMATPGKQGIELLEDLEKTVRATRNLHNVSRYELNISCPNTHTEGGVLDARKQYQDLYDGMLEVMEFEIYPEQELWVKVSPDLDLRGVRDIVDVSRGHRVEGFTVANTTTNHDIMYILKSPGKGGASGMAVLDLSKNVQKMFLDYMGDNFSLIACGGINYAQIARDRTKDKRVKGIQIYTPLIFEGPKLLRNLRVAKE